MGTPVAAALLATASHAAANIPVMWNRRHRLFRCPAVRGRAYSVLTSYTPSSSVPTHTTASSTTTHPLFLPPMPGTRRFVLVAGVLAVLSSAAPAGVSSTTRFVFTAASDMPDASSPEVPSNCSTANNCGITTPGETQDKIIRQNITGRPQPDGPRRRATMLPQQLLADRNNDHNRHGVESRTGGDEKTMGTLAGWATDKGYSAVTDPRSSAPKSTKNAKESSTVMPPRTPAHSSPPPPPPPPPPPQTQNRTTRSGTPGTPDRPRGCRRRGEHERRSSVFSQTRPGTSAAPFSLWVTLSWAELGYYVLVYLWAAILATCVAIEQGPEYPTRCRGRRGETNAVVDLVQRGGCWGGGETVRGAAAAAAAWRLITLALYGWGRHAALCLTGEEALGSRWKRGISRVTNGRISHMPIARLLVLVLLVLLGGGGRGAEAAVCTGTMCCDKVVPTLDAATTTTIDNTVCTSGPCCSPLQMII